MPVLIAPDSFNGSIGPPMRWLSARPVTMCSGSR